MLIITKSQPKISCRSRERSAELPAVKQPQPLPESSSVPLRKKAPAKKAEATGIPARDYSIEDLAHTDEFKEYITAEMGKGKLCSSLTSSDLDDKIKDLYRGSKTSIEENGASTLYLAVGFIKWFEKDKPDALLCSDPPYTGRTYT